MNHTIYDDEDNSLTLIPNTLHVVGSSYGVFAAFRFVDHFGQTLAGFAQKKGGIWRLMTTLHPSWLPDIAIAITKVAEGA